MNKVSKFEELSNFFNFIKHDSGIIMARKYKYNDCDPVLSSVKEIKIPDGVTILDNLCFHNLKNLKAVHIPSSVRYIGERCFMGCTGLGSIVIPDSVIDLKDGCFVDCVGLYNISIGAGVSSLPNSCFYNTGIRRVDIPSNIHSIENFCFSYCSQLEVVNLAGVKELKEGVFEFTNRLKSVHLNDGITSIGKNVVYCSFNLTNLYIPDSVQDIDFDCFTGLAYISIPKHLESAALAVLQGFNVKVIVRQ